jgi:phenylpyruvate tautomerase PptA (4-oxalocrotonate tautomerase family)
VPIIEIHALPPDRGLDVPTALAEVTGAVAAYLGEEPRGTWAVWRSIEAGSVRGGRGRSLHPAPRNASRDRDVFAGRRDDTPELLRAVGRAVVEAFGLDDGNVVVRLTEADPIRVYWGD